MTGARPPDEVWRRRAAALCLAVSTGALAAEPPAAAPQAPPVGPGPNVLETLAGRAGITTCLNAVKNFGPALSGPPGTQAVVLMTHPVAPDASAFGVSIERAEPTGVRFVSATFAPTARGGCDLSYDMVDTWRKSCQDVALEELKYTRPLAIVGQHVFVVPYTATHHLYLIRVPGGCISIGKELVFP